MELKYCKICGKQLLPKNKTGYCNTHRPRCGEHNSFFGKTHSEATRKVLKEKCTSATKELWKNEEYRQKVIKNTTGKKRNDEFKEKQRQNALKQFKDPKQRQIRSEKMKESWEKGNIPISSHVFMNHSKQEELFVKILQENYNSEILLKQTLFYYDEEQKKRRWLFPDIILPSEHIIIEYQGSYWHADPNRYGETNDFLVKENLNVAEIRKRDIRKKEIYESLGYTTIWVWGDSFMNNKEETIFNVIKQINEIKQNVEE